MIISIEGCDQAGKNTQTGFLLESLLKEGIKAVRFDFPDYTSESGKAIREILYNGMNNMEKFHRLLAQNRGEHSKEIEDLVNSGVCCIMNRYIHSNFIYGVQHGVEIEKIVEFETNANLLPPDNTILLDCNIADVWGRKQHKDEIEADKEFLSRVIIEYRKLAKAENWLIIKNDKKETMAEKILENALTWVKS